MARRLRRSRYRRRLGYQRRSYRRRRIYGKRRAASQQKQRANFTVKSTYTGYIQVDPIVRLLNDQYIDTDLTYQNVGGSAVISVYRNLLKSSYFQSIRTMYDQVRVNSCKITITPTTSVLAQGVKQGLFVSAWDRNGVDDPKQPPSISEITAHSSSFQKPINLDASAWKATRKIVASTISEKSAFIPTGMLANTDNNLTGPSGFLASLGQNNSLQWNPQLLIGILLGSSSNVAQRAPQTWGFVAQFEWSLTFRGLRYDVQNNNGAVQQVQAIVNPTAAPSVGITSVPPGTNVSVETARALSSVVTQPQSIRSIDMVYREFIITSIDVSTPYFVNENPQYVQITGGTATVNKGDEAKYMAVVSYADRVVGTEIIRMITMTWGFYSPTVNPEINYVDFQHDVAYYAVILDAVPRLGIKCTFNYTISSVPAGSVFDASVSDSIDQNVIYRTKRYGPIKLYPTTNPPYPGWEAET